MEELKVFTNEEFGSVRTTEIDGKPYFVANEVASILGYVSPKDAVSRHCKGGAETSLPYTRRRTRTEIYLGGRYLPFDRPK